jgi:hypothetical protein
MTWKPDREKTAMEIGSLPLFAAPLAFPHELGFASSFVLHL